MQSNTSTGIPFTMRVKSFVNRSPARMAVIIAITLYAFTIWRVPTAFNSGAIITIIMLTLLLSFASIGQTLVLIGGGLDFTIGAVMSSTAIITVTIMNGMDGNFFQAFVVVMLVSILIGSINGLCTVKIGLPPLIVTLAIANVISRMQFVLTGGSPIGRAAPAFINTINYRFFGIIPSLALYALIIFPLVFYLLNRSRYGRQLYLVGNNPEAARLAGMNANRVKFLSYVFSAMFAGFAGMLEAGYRQTALPMGLDGYAFTSLIAVIVGGTAFTGGVGSYTGSIAGALLMIVLSNMLTTLMLPLPIQNIVMGSVMVLLLLFYNRRKAVRQ